ncbi:MAG TPA: NYN domain-containing protein [Gemmatimonadaceae bacterium]|nr:NYN domain-containing protein [Gemmatimonadaceae bacterium]
MGWPAPQTSHSEGPGGLSDRAPTAALSYTYARFFRHYIKAGMNNRHPRREPSRSQSALVHRGPGAHSAPQATPLHHAPNAALLIDFDNVTMGIRSDLGKELRNLLGSDIIKGKVAVQRAYADWRRYPQYIVPLTEASIDLIYAPAYGSSKKNATDIRLAIDAMELVFSRPEIGTIILLSGDSDFSSLVIKLKEYGKYVIGVGIRESSSDLLVMNCDEYYSYNALAGLVKSSDEEPRQKWDPWELVKEAITQMKQNHDVMRSDRLKQVMQEIDPTFDEKDLRISKFSKFCQEAAAKGLLSVRRLENGQLEVDVAGALPAEAHAPSVDAGHAPELSDERGGRDRGGRGRRGRGGRDREARRDTPQAAGEVQRHTPPSTAVPAARDNGGPGTSGERLTRDEAFDLLRRTVDALVHDDDAVRASVVRSRARELLGRDSESLSERNFVRILKDAHDADVLDLRRRGNDFDVARASAAPPVTEQLARTEPPRAADSGGVPARPSIRGRAVPRGRGGLATLPPELLSLGVVVPESSGAMVNETSETTEESPAPAKRGRKRARPASSGTEAAAKTGAKRPRRARAKKSSRSEPA